MPDLPVLVVEDDRFLRLVQLALDPETDAERRAAYADFVAHDEPDFAGWCARVQSRAGALLSPTSRRSRASMRSTIFRI